jgi:hypothetical protein
MYIHTHTHTHTHTNTHIYTQPEQWTYTSPHKPFHNHWWLITILFSVTHRCLGGVAGLICLRGLATCALFKMILALRSGGKAYWLVSALLFRIMRHRLQIRPEMFCVLIFLGLFHLRRRLAAREASRQNAASRQIWDSEVIYMYLLVILACNCHFGVVPFIILAAGTLLADGIFTTETSDSDPDSDSDSDSDSVLILSCLRIDTVAFVRALPVVFLPLFNPQPFAGVAYILHHSPVTYSQHKRLSNPEMHSLTSVLQPLMTNTTMSKAEIRDKELLWLLAYVILCILVPFIWLNTPRASRHPGLTRPVPTLIAYMLLVLLSVDRARNLVWSTCFFAAMLSTACTPARTQPPSTSHGDGRRIAVASTEEDHSSVAVYGLLAAGVLLWDMRTPSLRAWTHTWPVRSAEFVKLHRPKGNVYHTITFGGYLVHALREYRHFADTREYCFAHLDEVCVCVCVYMYIYIYIYICYVWKQTNTHTCT